MQWDVQGGTYCQLTCTTPCTHTSSPLRLLSFSHLLLLKAEHSLPLLANRITDRKRQLWGYKGFQVLVQQCDLTMVCYEHQSHPWCAMRSVPAGPVRS